jgi:uncharacterized protein
MTLFRAVEDRRPRLVLVALFGMLLGYTLSRVGFTDYDELHAMFTFTDLRLVLVFAGGVGLSTIAYVALRSARPVAPRKIHQGTIAGGVLFGIGWAIAGACPGAAFAQLGEGKLHGLIAVVGVLVGAQLFRVAQRRGLAVDRGTCG